MYRAVTRQIEVTVEPNFLPERSSVDEGQYFWSYTIVITNTGAETVQLQHPALDHHRRHRPQAGSPRRRRGRRAARARAGRTLRIHHAACRCRPRRAS